MQIKAHSISRHHIQKKRENKNTSDKKIYILYFDLLFVLPLSAGRMRSYNNC